MIVKRITLSIFIICSLFIVGEIEYNDYRELHQVYFVVDLDTSVSGVSQVFYDVSRGYNEQNSHSIAIQHGKFQKYIFPLPTNVIKSIRFDPINVSAVVRIKSARIENRQGDIIKKFPLRDFIPIQQIYKMDTRHGALIIHTTRNANDPILEIANSSFDNHVSWLNYMEKRGGFIIGYGLLSFLLLIGLSYFVIFATRNQYIIGCVWRLKTYVAEYPGKYSAFTIGLFATMLFGIKLWLIGTYGNGTPFWDQWDAEAVGIYKPFLEGTLNWTNLFAPHNEHRIFTTRLMALALLNINGIWNHMLQMVVNAGLHIAALVLCIVLFTRVIGRDYLPALLVFSLVLFGVPYAWENTLSGFQSQFYFVLLFSIACLWFTVTQEPLSARWWVGVACGMLAFLSLASGIFALAAAAIIDLIFYVMGLRKNVKQLLAVFILAVLFTLGTVQTPSLAYHAHLKTSSIPQFIEALMAILGWPISSNLFSVLILNLPTFVILGWPMASNLFPVIILNLPTFVFVGVMLWKRPPANDSKWFLLALVVWSLGQAVSIAYGRAVGNLSSRYLDLFAISILVNFVCLILIAQDHIGKKYVWTIIGVSVWTITVLFSLGLYAGKRMPAELAEKRDTGLAQEINTRNYLATGDFIHLKDKAYLHVPYPDSKRLASILASPTIRAILPTNIRIPLEPVLVASQPADAFVIDGYYPSTPKRTGISVGSYSAQGVAATGEVTIQFDTSKQSAMLAIPVTGYPLSSGIKLEVEQNGQRNPVSMKSNPKESWAMAYVKVESGAFSIKITDSSTTAWVAIGAPLVMGKLDALINGLLANYLVFMLLGLVGGVSLITVSGLTNRITKSIGN